MRGQAFFTGELADHGNAPDISCIPEGRYVCPWEFSARFKRFMYGIVPVAGRAGVRIHSANFMGDSPPFKRQLNGCVALGLKLGWMDGQKALLLSVPAIRQFESLLRGERFELEVKRG